MEKYLAYINSYTGIAALLGSTAAMVLYAMKKAFRVTSRIDTNRQSIEIPNTSGTRQSTLVPLGTVSGFLDDTNTLFMMMKRGCYISDDGPCLGWKGSDKEYHWLTYREVIKRACDIGSGFVHLGMKPGNTTHVGVYSGNCLEWIICEQACYSQSVAIVPLHDILGSESVAFIINQAELTIVVCDKEDKVLRLLEQREKIPNLKHIVLIDRVPDEMKETAALKNIGLHSFENVMSLGKDHPVPVLAPNSSDLATICYTSGTTGPPKGVMITHENMITSASAFILHLGEHAPSSSDVMLSYLPLAHMYERIIQVAVYLNGGSVGFFGGNVRFIMDDMKLLRPTIVASVPRVLNKIYEQTYADTVDTKLKGFLLNYAISKKQSILGKLILQSSYLWSFFSKSLKQEFGGKMRLIIVSTAPLSFKVLSFFRTFLRCLVLEGYGQTEATGVCAFNITSEYKEGSVGPPTPCCHIKLVDVPEMGYYSANGEGEICIKGPTICKGYFKNPEMTAQVIEPDGWLHSGDIGLWLPNGTLKIIDRSKHLLKLSQGEYISPEKIENIYVSSKFVEQIFVCGESLQDFLVAIIVPARNATRQFCKDNDISGSWEEMNQNEVLKDAILQDITAIGKQQGLVSLQQVKGIHLHPGVFTAENGLLTSTLKLSRHDCYRQFKQIIHSLYQESKSRRDT